MKPSPRILSRRRTLVLIAVVALVLPTVFLLRASRAQNRKGETAPPQALSGTRTLKPQQSALEPVSSTAVGFARSRPLSEVARRQTTSVSRKSVQRKREKPQKTRRSRK